MGRFFMPCTVEFLAEKIWTPMKVLLVEDGHTDEEIEEVKDKKFSEKVVAFSGFDYGSMTGKIRKDLGKVDFGNENVTCEAHQYGRERDKAIMGFHKSPKMGDFAFLGVKSGGDWEFPVFFIIYWDGSDLRGYIPTSGNPLNTYHKSAYGNHEDDDENAKERFGVDSYEEVNEDIGAIIEDIRSHIAVSPRYSGVVSGDVVITKRDDSKLPSDLELLLAIEKILDERPPSSNSIVNQHATSGIVHLAQHVVEDLKIALQERDEARKHLDGLKESFEKIKRAMEIAEEVLQEK